MPQVSELSRTTLVGVSQQKSADPGARNQRVMIAGRKLRTCLVKRHTFELGKERSPPSRKAASNDETGTTYPAEVLAASNKPRSDAPNPPMCYELASGSTCLG